MEHLNNTKKVREVRKSFCRESKFTICFYVEKILAFFREKVCYSKEEMQDINCQVEETKSKAKKFEVVEEKIPDFFAIAQKLQAENDNVRNDNFYLILKVEELYNAEKKFNIEKRISIYDELGFDISVFENRKLIN